MFEKDSPERTSHREKRDFSLATKMPPGDPSPALSPVEGSRRFCETWVPGDEPASADGTSFAPASQAPGICHGLECRPQRA